ncbi:PREDICTED: juvenile hormone acid O-methyltransferase-like [Rhagoletis zephyria]|uniref:juvenile hormone acid O-methyltransferase-like n=1 Tax=Rhagoletis zephyria TaxID=28612 RepID=UPI00081183C2|nr:PREDICTED: juvenile hormone acid O-methyltransferase-like [Rhagoletis zephyria]
MNQPSLYRRASGVQRRDAKQIWQQYMKVMQWRADGRDTLIDIGSGSGNVLMQYIYPIMPAQFDAVWAIDISERMIDFARKNYGDSERAHFEVLDITCAQLPQRLCGQFDHVTSFYCLHWVHNQKRALLNIYQLLRRSGGDCLLVFLANHSFFDVYIELSKSNKWCRYMTDTMQFVAPLYNSSDPSVEYSKLLHANGFVDFSVDIRNKIFVYAGRQTLKDNFKAISPYLSRIPESQHEEFLDDMIQVLLKMKLRSGQINEEDFKCTTLYKLVVVYARKSDGI